MGASRSVHVKVHPSTGLEEGVEEYLYSFFKFGGRWHRWSTPRPGSFFLPGKRHGTHFTIGWVSHRAGLCGCRKFFPYWDSIRGPSGPFRVAIPAHTSRFEQVTNKWACCRPGPVVTSQNNRIRILTGRWEICAWSWGEIWEQAAVRNFQEEDNTSLYRCGCDGWVERAEGRFLLRFCCLWHCTFDCWYRNR